MTSSGLDGTADPRAAEVDEGHDESTGDAVPASPAKSGLRQAMTIALSLGLGIAVLVFVIPQFADLDKVWEQVQAMTGLEIAVLAVAAMWNLITYWIVIVLATPGITYPQAAVVTESTTAVANTVPAGGAVAVGLNYAMLASWGFSKSRATLSVIVTGLWNNFAKLAMPILALAFLAAPGRVGWRQDRRCRRGSGRPRRERRGVRPHLAQRGLRRSGCSRRRSLGVGRFGGSSTEGRSRDGTSRWSSSGAGSSVWCETAGWRSPSSRSSGISRCTPSCSSRCARSACRRTRSAGPRCSRSSRLPDCSLRSPSPPAGSGSSRSR